MVVLTVTLLVLAAVSAVVVGALLARRRSRLLRRRFGSEYLRLLMESGGRRDTERELARRLRRHRALRPRALSEEERATFTAEWAGGPPRRVTGPLVPMFDLIVLTNAGVTVMPWSASASTISFGLAPGFAE
jgi:hypothetical protein